MSFQTVINLYMMGEVFSAWGLFAVASILTFIILKDEKLSDRARSIVAIIIMAIWAIGLVLMLHSLGKGNATEIRDILNDAYKHPYLWGARR